MSSVYFCDVSGDGASMQTAFRPNIATTGKWSVVMLDEAAGKAIVAAQDNTLAGTGIIRVLTGTTLANLRDKARTTNPTPAQRTALSNWLAANGYRPLTAAQTSWGQCLHFIAQQVNPVADLDRTG